MRNYGQWGEMTHPQVDLTQSNHRKAGHGRDVRTQDVVPGVSDSKGTLLDIEFGH